jgi:hypothetical protein
MKQLQNMSRRKVSMRRIEHKKEERRGGSRKD